MTPNAAVINANHPEGLRWVPLAHKLLRSSDRKNFTQTIIIPTGTVRVLRINGVHQYIYITVNPDTIKYEFFIANPVDLGSDYLLQEDVEGRVIGVTHRLTPHQIIGLESPIDPEPSWEILPADSPAPIPKTFFNRSLDNQRTARSVFYSKGRYFVGNNYEVPTNGFTLGITYLMAKDLWSASKNFFDGSGAAPIVLYSGRGTSTDYSSILAIKPPANPSAGLTEVAVQTVITTGLPAREFGLAITNTLELYVFPLVPVNELDVSNVQRKSIPFPAWATVSSGVTALRHNYRFNSTGSRFCAVMTEQWDDDAVAGDFVRPLHNVTNTYLDLVFSESDQVGVGEPGYTLNEPVFSYWPGLCEWEVSITAFGDELSAYSVNVTLINSTQSGSDHPILADYAIEHPVLQSQGVSLDDLVTAQLRVYDTVADPVEETTEGAAPHAQLNGYTWHIARGLVAELVFRNETTATDVVTHRLHEGATYSSELVPQSIFGVGNFGNTDFISVGEVGTNTELRFPLLFKKIRSLECSTLSTALYSFYYSSQGAYDTFDGGDRSDVYALGNQNIFSRAVFPGVELEDVPESVGRVANTHLADRKYRNLYNAILGRAFAPSSVHRAMHVSHRGDVAFSTHIDVRSGAGTEYYDVIAAWDSRSQSHKVTSHLEIHNAITGETRTYEDYEISGHETFYTLATYGIWT